MGRSLFELIPWPSQGEQCKTARQIYSIRRNCIPLCSGAKGGGRGGGEGRKGRERQQLRPHCWIFAHKCQLSQPTNQKLAEKRAPLRNKQNWHAFVESFHEWQSRLINLHRWNVTDQNDPSRLGFSTGSLYPHAITFLNIVVLKNVQIFTFETLCTDSSCGVIHGALAEYFLLETRMRM